MSKGRFHGIETEALRRPHEPSLPCAQSRYSDVANDQGQQFWNEAVWVWAVYELLCKTVDFSIYKPSR